MEYYEYYWMVFVGVIALSVLMIVVQKAFQNNNMKFSMKQVSSQKTGYQTALDILAANGITDVQVTSGVEGKDNFNPRTKVIQLSPSVYSSSSLSAVTIAAHEVGHAIQWNKGEVKIKLRDGLAAPVQLVSKVGNSIMMIGFFMWIFTWGSTSNAMASWTIFAGLLIYGATGLFQFVTLPVEFGASKKALKQLTALEIVNKEEISNSKKLLNSAAMTYVMAFLTSAVMFAVYMMLLLRRRN